MITTDIRDRVVELKRVRANELLPHPKNAREHPEAQRNALRAVMGQLGFAGAILAVERDGKYLVADGHLRTEEMGDREVPVLVLDLNDDEVETLLLSFDSVGAMAKFNRERLETLLATHDRLKASLDPSMLNGMQADLDKMLAQLAKQSGSDWGKPQEATQDEVPEAPAIPVTEPGDLWILGRHRVKCGDATKPDDVAHCLAGARPFIMVTDPPYGVDYDPSWRNDAAEAGHLAYAARRVGEVPNDHREDWSEAWRLFPGAVGYCWHADRHASSIQRHFEACGFEMRSQIIWSKSNYPISRGHYHWRHEPCWYFVRAGETAKWNGARDQTTVWEVNLDKNVEGGHSTQKPVECMQRPLRNHGGPEDDVYDPFLGSGTTLVAAHQLGRRCFGLEIDPKYADVSVVRWMAAAGQEAVLEATGETFTQVKERRTQERAAQPQPESPPPPEPATIPEPTPAEPKSSKHGKKRSRR